MNEETNRENIRVTSLRKTRIIAMNFDYLHSIVPFQLQREMRMTYGMLTRAHPHI